MVSGGACECYQRYLSPPVFTMLPVPPNADATELLAETTFEVQLTTIPASVSVLPRLSQWHVPPTCPAPLLGPMSAAALEIQRSADCVSELCTGVQCNYTLALPTAGLRYSLSVGAASSLRRLLRRG
jgi:hypothetical protein